MGQQERVDVLDPEGNPTGQIKLKEDAHRDEDWHAGAHVWIVNSKGDILLQKRADTKLLAPGKWDISAAGHVSSGETSLSTAIRETQEELGLTYSQDQFKFLFRQKQVTPLTDDIPHNCWDDVYLVQDDIDPKRLRFPDQEVAGVKFIPYKEFESQLADNSIDVVPHKEEYEKLLAELKQRYS